MKGKRHPKCTGSTLQTISNYHKNRAIFVVFVGFYFVCDNKGEYIDGKFQNQCELVFFVYYTIYLIGNQLIRAFCGFI